MSEMTSNLIVLYYIVGTNVNAMKTIVLLHVCLYLATGIKTRDVRTQWRGGETGTLLYMWPRIRVATAV